MQALTILRILPLLALLLAMTTLTVEAATYYIDYSAGNDANSGQTKTAAWKRHPYMKGFLGGSRYSHSAGDRFIFKGGVTWPVSCFQMLIPVGGASDSARDYYGVDQTWFSGTSWTRPLFDFQRTLLGSGWTYAAGVKLDSASYVTIDNLELANLRAPLSINGVSSWGTCSLLIHNASSYVTVSNCVIRDWDLPTPVPDGSDGGGGIWYLGIGGGQNIVITRCVLHQANTAVKCGRAISIWGEVSFTEIYGTSNAILGSGSFHDNHIHHLVAATDAASHPNAIGTFAPSQIYNNLIHHLEPAVAAIFLCPDWGGSAGIDLVFNNVVYSVGFQAPIQLDTGGRNPGGSGLRAYNNTLEHGYGYCIRMVNRGTAVYGVLDARNNHFITSATALLYNAPEKLGAYVNSVTLINNVSETPDQCAANGYFAANHYAPTLSTGFSVDGGADLSSVYSIDINNNRRPAGARWDVGAYEYNGVGAPRINSSPVISSIQSSVPDASSTITGMQVLEGSTVTLSAGVSDADGDPIAWSWRYAVNGGAEVSFSSGSGANTAATFTYPVGTAGRVYSWRVLASDNATTAQAQFSLGVIAAASVPTSTIQPPVITVQPQSRTITAGSAVTFSVTATGQSLAYQWRFNGANIAGANASSITITSAQPAKNGSYDVVVSNSAGVVTSSKATLTVVLAPVASLINGSFEGGVAPWSTSGVVRVSTSQTTGASDGVAYAAFNYGQQIPSGVLSQTFATTPGQRYSLTFDLGAFSLVNKDQQRVLVAVNGGSALLSQVRSVYAPGNGSAYVPQSLSFTADSTAATLKFTDVSTVTKDVDLLIDRVQVTAQTTTLTAARTSAAVASAAPASSIIYDEGGPTVLASGLSAGTYQIERSADLKQWSSLGAVQVSHSGDLVFDDGGEAPPARGFYRIVQLSQSPGPVPDSQPAE